MTSLILVGSDVINLIVQFLPLTKSLVLLAVNKNITTKNDLQYYSQHTQPHGIVTDTKSTRYYYEGKLYRTDFSNLHSIGTRLWYKNGILCGFEFFNKIIKLGTLSSNLYGSPDINSKIFYNKMKHNTYIQINTKRKINRKRSDNINLYSK